MADLSKNASLRYRFPQLQKRTTWALDNSSAQTLYKGQPLILDGSTDTVYGVGFTSSITLAATDVTLGILAAGYSIATTDIEGQVEAEIIMSGEVGFKSAVFTNADVGKSVYMSDSATLTATSTANLYLGKLSAVEDGYAYVNINPDGVPSVNSHI